MFLDTPLYESDVQHWKKKKKKKNSSRVLHTNCDVRAHSQYQGSDPLVLLIAMIIAEFLRWARMSAAAALVGNSASRGVVFFGCGGQARCVRPARVRLSCLFRRGARAGGRQFPQPQTLPSPASSSVYAATGATMSIACGRLPYTLGLPGPCASCDTACSAALVAAHLGLRAVQLTECAVGLVLV